MEKQGVAVVFPGQGSQRPGMGKDFYDNILESRHIYHEASDALGWDVAAMCFGGDERLNLTEYAQPCILTTEIAMLRGLHSLYGFSPAFFGGHSLGEYTALVAADVLSLPETLPIVQVRGNLMQEAMPVGVGGMSAIISDDIDAGMIRDTLKDLPVDVANINSADQVVISGVLSAMHKAEKLLKDVIKNQILRFVPLNVSAPFHSRFMDSIREAFEDALRALMKMLTPGGAKRVTSNFTGGFHSNNPDEIVNNLVLQLSNTVKWRDNMYALSSRADEIYEIGPTRPLRSFFKTIDVTCSPITTLSAAKRVFERNL
ncbi:MAG: ACP S-malonyltransferase [Proteobacteria bacterium]|nr:ACP S-malonyltransferase [Pseudomonadota bacterium]